MKSYASLLALALLFFAMLACSGKIGSGDDKIKNLYMAKDSGGSAGDKTSSFSPSDRTVYCVAELNNADAGTKVKFVWIAVDVVDTLKNEKIKDIEYTTKAMENKVSGHLSYPQDWPKGTYKVEAYVNDKLEKSVEYKVE